MTAENHMREIDWLTIMGAIRLKMQCTCPNPLDLVLCIQQLIVNNHRPWVKFDCKQLFGAVVNRCLLASALSFNNPGAFWASMVYSERKFLGNRVPQDQISCVPLCLFQRKSGNWPISRISWNREYPSWGISLKKYARIRAHVCYVICSSRSSKGDHWLPNNIRCLIYDR